MIGMMGRTALAGGILLLLGACGGSKTVTADNASTAEVAQKVKEAGGAENFISPGHWKMTMTIEDMAMPSMPPEVAARMKGSLGKPRVIENCVTPEQAKKPKEDFFAGKDAANCRYEHFAMGNGLINMVMHCGEGKGMQQTVKMDGTYSAEAYHMTINSSAQGGGNAPAGGMSMKATMDAKRTGICTGKEEH